MTMVAPASTSTSIPMSVCAELVTMETFVSTVSNLKVNSIKLIFNYFQTVSMIYKKGLSFQLQRKRVPVHPVIMAAPASTSMLILMFVCAEMVIMETLVNAVS